MSSRRRGRSRASHASWMWVNSSRGLAGDAVGVERGVVLRCLGGRQHHLLHALAPAPAHARGPDGADRG